MHESVDRGEGGAMIARHGLADRPRRHIGLVVDRQHEPLVILLEMIVGLGRAPFLMAWAPRGGHESRRAGDRTRLASRAVGHIGAKQLVLVGDEDDLVVGTGGEVVVGARLLAGWYHADIVAPAAGNILIFTLIDDVGAEALRGATDRLDISE